MSRLRLHRCSPAPRSVRGPAGHAPRILAGVSQRLRPRSLQTGRPLRATSERDVEPGSFAWLALLEFWGVKGCKPGAAVAEPPLRVLRRSSDQSLPTSCASIERMVASGSEPTYQPRMSYTSFAALLLRAAFAGLKLLGAANTVVAVPSITARAIAIFVMGGLQSCAVFVRGWACVAAGRLPGVAVAKGRTADLEPVRSRS